MDNTTDSVNAQEVAAAKAKRRDALGQLSAPLTTEDQAIMDALPSGTATLYDLNDSYDYVYQRRMAYKDHASYHHKHVSLGCHRLPSREWVQALFDARARAAADYGKSGENSTKT